MPFLLHFLLLSSIFTHTSSQNSAIEASVADRNEDFQQFNPTDTFSNEPNINQQSLQRPPAPSRPEFIGGTATSTTLTARWKGTWTPSVSAYPVGAFEVQFRHVGDPTWVTATSFGSNGNGIGVEKYHHEIQTVTTRANVGQTIQPNSWFRLSLHARGMNDADPESKTQTVRIPYDATSEQFKTALDNLDNLRFGGTTKIVTRSETADGQGGFTWTVSYDVGKIGMQEDTSRLEDGRLSDATFIKDQHRNWPSLLVTETYFPGAAWTGGGLHVNVGTARVGTGANTGGNPDLTLGFNGNLHDAQSGLAACAHAGHLGTTASTGTHAGVEGPSYDQLRMAYPPSFCQITVTGLTPYSSFQLRVRARNVHGWSTYSDISDPIGRTKRGYVPSRSEAPMLTSKSGNEITIASKAAHDGIDGGNAWNGGEPVSSWDFQIQMVDSSSTGDNGLPTQIYGAQDASWRYHRRLSNNTVAGRRWRDVLPSMSRGGVLRPLQQLPARGASITATNLLPKTSYMFRTRAVNLHGPGPWSVGCVPIETMAGRPNAPSSPILDTSSTKGDTSLTIRWSYDYDLGTMDTLSNGAYVTSFEIESLDLTNVFYSEWKSNGKINIKTQKDTSSYRNEVQTISTRSDTGNPINDGWFMIGFNHNGKTTADPESNVVTSRIPYNANADVVKKELEKLSNIGINGILRVERNERLKTSELFETGGKDQILQSGVGASSSSSFRWTIVFDSTKGIEGSLSGDLPMLVIVGEGITAPWTGGGLQVNVVEVVKGGRKDVIDTYNERGDDQAPGLSKDDPAVKRDLRDAGKTKTSGTSDTTAAVPLLFTIHDLLPYTNYRFRVRAVSETKETGVSVPKVDLSEWSTSSRPMKTKATSRPWLVRPPSSTTGVIMLTGNGRETVNTEDPSFSFGAGRGGKGLEPGVGGSTLSRASMSGNDGLVVITSYVYGQTELPSTTFLFSGGEQLYTVPKSTVQGQIVAFVQIKAWGAGGGSGCGKQGSLSQLPSSNHSHGGGGGYAQALLNAQAGDLLRIRVGGGGTGCDGGTGGEGGWNGGGNGGGGDYGAGGGGGASEIWRMSIGSKRVDPSGRSQATNGDEDMLLVVAGGGGGGGTTDYCCAHGGAGGGKRAMSGVAPTLTTPRTNDPNDGTGVLRREFTSVIASEQSPPRMDPRDATGLPAFHQHTDAGLAPDADLQVLALPGGGGEQSSGGTSGSPGSSGSWAYSLNGEIYPIGGRDITSIQGAQASEATSGRRGYGGRGAFGKEGGGGGGGGYIGGGGGGSGVDGAGGGGGSGYVNYTMVFDPELSTGLEINPHAPSTPTLVTVNESSATIRWAPPRDSYLRSGAEPTMYYVEMSIGPSSQEFTVTYRRPGAGMVGFDGSEEARNYGPLVYTAIGLDSERTYRFRVRAKSRAMGVGPPSAAVVVRTTGKVENAWHRIRPRPLAQAQAGGGRRLHDPPTSVKPLAPSPRRGHTSVVIGGFMYVFGGRQDGYPCDVASTNTNRRGLDDIDPSMPTTTFCRTEGSVGATNELWRFDPRTHTWTLLDTVPDKRFITESDPSTYKLGRPVGRERHTAVVLVDNPGSFYEGRMIVFGGHAGGSETVKDGGDATNPTEYLGDLWQMDPDGFSTAVVRGGGEGLNITDARNLYVSTNTSDSSAKSESSSATFSSHTDGTDVSIDPSLCIADVNVRLQIEHSCTRDLKIELLGPGHSFRGAMHRESTSRQHGQGSSRQESSAAEDPPLSRDTPVLLFDGHDGSKSDECGVNIENVLFDDQAETAVNEDYLSPFKDISIRPLDRLDRYNGLQAAGDWTLHVYDRTENRKQGKIISWELQLTLRPCQARYRWTKLTPTQSGLHAAPPSARYTHTAIVIERSMFVWGGHNWGRLTDMWRLDGLDTIGSVTDASGIMSSSYPIETNLKWVQLTSSGISMRAPERYGRALVMTPWHILAFGGYTHTKFEPLMWRFDPFTRKWSQESVDAIAGASVAYKHRSTSEKNPNLFESVPMPRHLGSVVLMGLKGSPSRALGVKRPAVYLFGGYDGVGLLNDLWILDIEKIQGMAVDDLYTEDRFNGVCAWRVAQGGGLDNEWLGTCFSGGIGHSSEIGTCTINAVLLRSYCQKEWQSFSNF